jgi:hypothetical protein
LAIWQPVTNPTPEPCGRPEQLTQPARRDLFGDRRARRRHVAADVLIPRRRQPVGRERDRKRTTDHEAEVAGPGGRAEAGLEVTREILDDAARVLPALGQRLPETGAELLDPGRRAHRPRR